MLITPSLQQVDPTSDTVQFGGLSMHKPGLKVRTTQAFSEMVKQNLLQYGNAYFTYDFPMKREGMFKVRDFPLWTDFYYENLRYQPL